MIYIRGNPADYDEWRDLGWGWSDLKPYFLRAEDNVRGASEHHGSGGPLRVSDPVAATPLPDAFLESAAALGLPANEDFNGARQEGFGRYQTTTRDGRRGSTAVSYLHPVMDRPNLNVKTHLHVHRVLFEGTRAVGVEGSRLREMLEFRAEREGIVCGGAYLARQILTLSGIGRPADLELLQIPLVAEVPGVGLGLQDHPATGGTWMTKDPVSLKDALTDESLAAWATEGTGPLASNGVEAGGFLRTRADLALPDVQFNLVAAMYEQQGLLPAPAHGYLISVCVVKPQSRGQVAVVSPDPTTKPFILHNYYAEPEDLRSAMEGVRRTMELGNGSPLGDFSAGVFRGPESDSDADVEAYVRHTTQTIYHPTSTCRMGVDDLAVVDEELRVRGVEGVRVIDASIFPSVPRGNTNAPTIAVAEKAADLIRGRTAATEATAGAAAG
jgi:choline dehydrogenase-like flavoprotein